MPMGVSPLLGLLLEQAAELPVEYEREGRDRLVTRLLVAEIEQAPMIQLAAPFPTNRTLPARCQASLEQPHGERLKPWRRLV